MATPLSRLLQQIMSVDAGLIVIPWSFTINGTSNPTVWTGDLIKAPVRNSAGKFTLELRNQPYAIVGGDASMLLVASDTVDIYPQCDITNFAAATPTFVVKCKTGTANTDPPNGSIVGGYLIARGTTLKAAA